MGSHANRLRRAASLVADIAAETLWPTRCALCDAYGALLCERCVGSIPFLDQWRACTRCGAPWGLVQCSECNPITLAHLDREVLPYDTAVVSFGIRTDPAAVEAFKGLVPETYVIGDCSPVGGTGWQAVRSGFDIGMEL